MTCVFQYSPFIPHLSFFPLYLLPVLPCLLSTWYDLFVLEGYYLLRLAGRRTSPFLEIPSWASCDVFALHLIHLLEAVGCMLVVLCFVLFFPSPASNALKLPCPLQAAVLMSTKLKWNMCRCHQWRVARNAAIMNAGESWCKRHGSNENLGDAIRNHDLPLTEVTSLKNSN